ncbi:MAG: MarC family protein [Planctomycetaceae bacterium]
MALRPFAESALLLFVLLNPFLMSIYLLPLIQKLTAADFGRVLLRAAAIAGVVFALFAWAGDAVFRDVLQARFAAFLIFGGVVFVLIALRMVHEGGAAIETFRGSPKHVAGAVAMPFMIGPGTVSASVLAGSKLPVPAAILAIAVTLLLVVVSLVAMKAIHDWVNLRAERLVERYVEIVGRVSAIVIGTIAVEMLLQGVDLWLGRS